MATSLSDEELQKLFSWIDTIPLSRPKRNINRDFSDGVLAAEVVAYYFPRLVELHNYSQANSVQQKIYNWNTLNTKVLKKLGCQLTPQVMEDIVHCKAGCAESFLHQLQYKMAKYKATRQQAHTSTSSPHAHTSVRSPPNSATGHTHPSAHRSASHNHRSSGAVGGAAGANSGSGGFSDDDAFSPTSPESGRSPPHRRAAQQASSPTNHRSHPRSSSRGRVREGEKGGHHQGGGHERKKSHAAQQQHNHHQQQQHQGPSRAGRDALQKEVDEEILLEKEETIQELRETVEILEMKMSKLEQLLRLKDGKIQRLNEEIARLQAMQNRSGGTS